MSDYNEGDLVEAVDGDAMIRGRVTGEGMIRIRHLVPNLGIRHVYFPVTELAQTFAVTVIERARPALPTEPGAYESSLFPVALDNDPYLLTSAGWTIQGDDIDLDHMSRLTPLTRLEPVPVTAKKVLDALGEYLDGQLTGRTKNDIIGYLAAEFGVTGELGE
jgi:hypothetical protein